MEPITVETRMTPQDLKKFMQFTMFRKGKGLKPMMIAMIVVCALAIVSVLSMFFSTGFQELDFSTWLVLTVLPLLLVVFFLIPTISVHTVRRTSKIQFETTQRYTFEPDGVRIESVGPSLNSSVSVQYDAFHKAYETKDFFYLFISSQQALLIPKKSMKPAEEDDLSKLLQQKLEKVYHLLLKSAICWKTISVYMFHVINVMESRSWKSCMKQMWISRSKNTGKSDSIIVFTKLISSELGL